MKDLIKVYFLIFFFTSCDKKNEIHNDSEIKFRYYNLENSGWKSRLHLEKIDNISFTATEVPPQYYLLKDQGSENLQKVDSIYEANKTERIIEFTFQDENEDDLLIKKYTNLDYQASVEYMSFNIEQDFFLVTSKLDTVRCSGVLFERSFKTSPNNKIMLFFSGIKPDEKIQLVYEDKLFKKGTIKFRFKDPILKL